MELPGEVRAAAASKHRDQWSGMSWEGKLQAASAISMNELDPAISHKVADARRKQKARIALGSTAHPDDDQHSKHGLIVAALEALRGGAGRGGGHRALIPPLPTTPVPASSDAAQAAVPFDQFAQGTLPLPTCASPDHPREIAIWIDWCCLDQDASSLEIASSSQAGQRHGAISSQLQGVISSQLQGVAALIASCDLLLTPIADPAHAAWDYPVAWAPHAGISEISQAAAAAPPTSTGRSEGHLIRHTIEQNAGVGGSLQQYAAGYHPQGQRAPLEEYAAAGWAAYWGRAWCGTEALLSQVRYLVITTWCGTGAIVAGDPVTLLSYHPMPMSQAMPVTDRQQRARLVRGMLATSLAHGRRPHLLYGSKVQ